MSVCLCEVRFAGSLPPLRGRDASTRRPWEAKSERASRGARWCVGMEAQQEEAPSTSTAPDNLDRSLEEPAGAATKLEQIEALVVVLVLVTAAVLCVWLWRLRRWWREQRERHVKVLDEIEMCDACLRIPALDHSLFWSRLMRRLSSLPLSRG